MPISIDHMILGLISLAPCSGYDMKAACEHGEAGLVSALSYGSIYPRLKQLEQEGLIVTQTARQDGRQRRVHELTDKGWRELASWLEQPSEYPIPMRDELLLKLLFWGAAGVEREALALQLQERQQATQQILAYLIERRTDGLTFIDEYTSFVFNYIQSRLEAELSWISSTIAQLAAPASLPPQDPRWLSILQKARRTKAQTGERETENKQEETEDAE